MVPSLRRRGACRAAAGVRFACPILLVMLLALAIPGSSAWAQSSSGGDGLLGAIFPFFKPKPKVIRLQPAAGSSATGAGQPLKLVPAGLTPGIAGVDGDAGNLAAVTSHAEPPSGPGRPSYVTMCVRLCDGYYWPISNASRPANLRQDRELCESTCATPAKLYIQYSLGGDAAQMRDLDGKSYKKLKTAFLYRKSYVPSCRCTAEPWSDAEQARHQEYAMHERARRLNSELEAEMARASGAAVEEAMTGNEVAPTVADATVGPLPDLPETKDGPNPPANLPAAIVKRPRLAVVPAAKAVGVVAPAAPPKPPVMLVPTKVSPGSGAALQAPRKKIIKDPRHFSIQHR